MKALVLHELKQPLRIEKRPDLEPRTGEVVVELKAAALNRRDYWITRGMYPGVKTPIALGSDGAGVVTKLGDGVAHHWSNQQVIINPGWNWGDDPAAQSGQFRILGMPDDGTFATHVRVPASYLHAKPEHLDWHQAAALPLGGVTAYRAVFTQGGMKEGETVLISGIGGGVATFALQYAVAKNASVYVTSSSQEKIDRAVALGAHAGFDYRSDDWPKQFMSEYGTADLIIDSAGGDGYAQLIEVAAPGGRIVNYGATAGPPGKLDLFKVFWKQLHLIGSTMGSPDDFAAMLELVTTYEIEPVIDEVFPLAEGNTALERMRDSKQFGKIVLEC
jgi:NADPH:quinone reductase-like Zn-dependent oxidoreductase